MDVFINPALNANLDIKAKSIAGSISLNDLLPFLNIIKNENRHIVATLGEGGNNIYISITTGFIELHKLE